jgi:hypothetical protein
MPYGLATEQLESQPLGEASNWQSSDPSTDTFSGGFDDEFRYPEDGTDAYMNEYIRDIDSDAG